MSTGDIESSKPEPFNPLAPHHLYIGIFLMVMGALASFSWSTESSAFIIALGGAISLDDIVEHTLTKQTPLRRFFEAFIMPFVSR